MTLKDLTELKFKQDREDRPSVPTYAVPRTVYTDKTANGLTKAIKTFCDIKGVMCQRTGSEGRYRPGKNYVDVIGRTRIMKGTYLPGQNNGQGDLCLTIKGKVHWVEVKIGRDVQSEVQKDFEAMVKRAGGVYVVVKTWEDFYSNFKKWIR
jgi:hypothetical protein